MRKVIVFFCVVVGLMICSTCFSLGQELEKSTGVTIYIPDKSYKGYTLYNSRPQEEAVLIDMNGNILHRWSYPQGFRWENSELLPNGNIIVLIPNDYRKRIGGMLFELDWDSNLVWTMNIAVHHDFEKLENGNFLVICRERVINDVVGSYILESDRLIEITPKEKVVWEWHTDQHALELKNFVDVDFPIPIRVKEKLFPRPLNDWAHTNSVEVLRNNPSAQKDSRFKKGNILFSPRNINTIGVIDRETEEIVWAWGPGELEKQHNPTMLDNGNILIYDNGIKEKRGYTRIIELDPLTEKIVWEYKAAPPESFFSPIMGGCQRLPNGNTFIVDSTGGRLFEVTPAGDIVWEYLNPDLLPNGTRMRIYRSLRYSQKFVEKIISSK